MHQLDGHLQVIERSWLQRQILRKVCARSVTKKRGPHFRARAGQRAQTLSRISPFHTDISAAFLSIPAGSSAQTSHAQRRVVRVCVYACVRVRQRARATRAGGAHRRHTSRPRVRSRWPGSPPASPPPPPPAPYAKPSRPVTRFHVADPGTCWLPLRGRPRAAAAASPGDRSRRYCSGRQPPRPRVRQPKRRVRHAQVAGVSHRCLRRPGFSCGETQLPQRLTTLEARCYTLRTLPAAASSRLACPAAAFTDAWWRPACPERASR